MPQARQRLDIPKPYTTLELNGAVLRFYHGDCLEILASLDKETISAIVTSPPYNLGIEYRTYRDTLPRKNTLTGATRGSRRPRGRSSPKGRCS
jgi:hypothetical protein